MIKSADADQLASSEANWSGSTNTDLELHCLLKQDISCSAREGLRNNVHELWKPIFLQKNKEEKLF